MDTPQKPSPVPHKRVPPDDDDERDPGFESGARSPATSPWVVVLGVASVVFLILTVVFWNRSASRERTIQANTNHLEQVEASAVVLQTEIEAAKANTTRLEKQLAESRTEAAQLKTALTQAKADAVQLQELLDKSRNAAANFQTQLTEAKVASIQSQAETERNQKQMAATQAALDQLKSDSRALEGRLTEAVAKAAELQRSLDNARLEISRLQKPPAKK